MLSDPRQRMPCGRMPEHFEWSQTKAILDSVHAQWAQPRHRERRPQADLASPTAHNISWKQSCFLFTLQTPKKIYYITDNKKTYIQYLLSEIQQRANTAARFVICCDKKRTSNGIIPPWKLWIIFGFLHWPFALCWPPYTDTLYIHMEIPRKCCSVYSVLTYFYVYVLTALSTLF